MYKTSALIFIFFVTAVTAQVQPQEAPRELQIIKAEPKKQNVDPYIEQLKKFKVDWAKKVKESGNSYTLTSNVQSMIGSTITVMKIDDGKVTNRKVSYDFRGGTPPKAIDEKVGSINKNNSGSKAKTMEEFITEAEKMLSDYKAGKIKGTLYFKIKDYSLMCLLTPHMVACHPGNGVRINSCNWNK